MIMLSKPLVNRLASFQLPYCDFMANRSGVSDYWTQPTQNWDKLSNVSRMGRRHRHEIWYLVYSRYQKVRG